MESSLFRIDHSIVNIYELLRPFLFSLPPEWAHQLTLNALRLYGYLPTSSSQNIDPIDVGGLRVRNRLGIAAGFDKDGIALRGLDKLNVGFLELGAVTPLAQPGNPRPRVFRVHEDFALINRLGFNNRGIDALVQKIVKDKAQITIPIGINIGKNFDTPMAQAIDDFEFCFRRANSLVDFVTINVSSPNTPGLRKLQSLVPMRNLLARLVQLRSTTTGDRPRPLLLVKISPDLSVDEIDGVCSVIREQGIDGIIATNTTVARPVRSTELPEGGLSGPPLLPRALKCVQQARAVLGQDFLIIGCGGICDVESAQQMREAGADLLQIYTGLVYRGPSCLKEISQVV